MEAVGLTEVFDYMENKIGELRIPVGMPFWDKGKELRKESQCKSHFFKSGLNARTSKKV